MSLSPILLSLLRVFRLAWLGFCDMAFTRGPVSPHLGVYRFGLSAFLSILHRITSVVIFAGLLVFSWFFILSGYMPDSRFVVNFHSVLSGMAGKTALFCWLSCILYHSSNGVRHLCSDCGIAMTCSGVVKSGILMLLFVSCGMVALFYFLFIAGV